MMYDEVVMMIDQPYFYIQSLTYITPRTDEISIHDSLVWKRYLTLKQTGPESEQSHPTGIYL